jgi:hypothetical protein
LGWHLEENQNGAENFLDGKSFFLVGEKVFHDRQKSVFIVNIEERV